MAKAIYGTFTRYLLSNNFKEDFKTLNSWQKILITIIVFFAGILCFCFSWIVLLPNYSFATTDPLNSDDPLTRLVYVYRSQIGVKELTGNNDGLEVQMYLESVGLKRVKRGVQLMCIGAFKKLILKQLKVVGRQIGLN